MFDMMGTFGISGRELAQMDAADPQTPMHRGWATTDADDYEETPSSPVRALLDPRGSAIFWVALAALLGLVLLTGQVKLEAAVGGRAGKR